MVEGTVGEVSVDQVKAMDATTAPGSGSTGASSITSEIALGFLVSNGPQGDTAGTPQSSYTDGQRRGTVEGTTDLTIHEIYKIGDFSSGTAAQLTGATSRDWVSGVMLVPEGVHPNLLATIELRVEDYFVVAADGVSGAIVQLEADLEGRFPPHYEVTDVTVTEE